MQLYITDRFMLQTPGLNIITEYIIGYIYPGYPVANMCFKVYGYISMTQAITFLQDFKLGHYMKIPPRTMFMAQVSVKVVFSFPSAECLFPTNLTVASSFVLDRGNPHCLFCVPGNCLVADGEHP